MKDVKEYKSFRNAVLLLVEDCSSTVYLDTVGNVTVGVGVNLTPRGSDGKNYVAEDRVEFIEGLLSKRLDRFRNDLGRVVDALNAEGYFPPLNTLKKMKDSKFGGRVKNIFSLRVARTARGSFIYEVKEWFDQGIMLNTNQALDLVGFIDGEYEARLDDILKRGGVEGISIPARAVLFSLVWHGKLLGAKNLALLLGRKGVPAEAIRRGFMFAAGDNEAFKSRHAVLAKVVLGELNPCIK